MPPRLTPVEGDPFSESFAASNTGDRLGSSERNPVRGLTPAQIQKLPPGTWAVAPDGRSLQVGARFNNRVAPGGPRRVSPEEMRALRPPAPQRPSFTARPEFDAQDTARGLDAGIEGGAASLLGTPGMAAEYLGSRPAFTPGGQASRAVFEGLGKVLPNPSEVYDFFNQDGETLYEPETVGGQYARSIGEQAPAALTGRGWMRVADPVLSGVGAQALGDFAADANPEWEGYGRALGGFGGSISANAVPNGRELAMLGRSLEGIDPAQQQAIQQLMQDAHGRGIQLTLAEAADQVTGGQGVGRLQRFVESTAEGQGRFGGLVRDRPAQVAGAVNQSLDDVFPPAPPPGLVAMRGQEAAEGTLATARQRVNDSARPLYDQLPGQQVDPGYQAFLENDPSYLKARDYIRTDPVYAARYGNVPDNDMEFQNVVVQRMRTDAENARPTEMRDGDRFRAGMIGESADNARAIGDVTSPEYTLARQTVETGHRAFVDPLVAGPLGRIAGEKVNPQLGSQTGALFPAAPFPGADAETAQALQLMALRDPNIGADLTRAHLGQTFAEASQDLSSGPNPWGGAGWRAKVAGNPIQRQTLEGALAETGGEDINSLLDVLAATGKRQHPGSMTAFNTEDMERLKGTNALSGMLSRPNPWQWLGEKVEGANASRNATALSDALLSSPDDAINVMNRAQGVAKDNPLLRAMLASYLSQ